MLAIDPGDPGERRSACTYSVAEVLRDELAAMGAKPSLLRGTRRAARPDRAGAGRQRHGRVDVRLDRARERPAARHRGPTVSYFGSDQTHSPAGMLLAQLILEEVEAALGARGRLQRLAVSMLRETRMPAVQVEPAFITNAREAALIEDPRVRRARRAERSRRASGASSPTDEPQEQRRVTTPSDRRPHRALPFGRVGARVVGRNGRGRLRVVRHRGLCYAPMRFCLMLEGQEGVTWPDWLAAARTAERLGFEAIFTSDHYLSP